MSCEYHKRSKISRCLRHLDFEALDLIWLFWFETDNNRDPEMLSIEIKIKLLIFNCLQILSLYLRDSFTVFIRWQSFSFI